MRFAVTSHAIDRWAELDGASHATAEVELRAACGARPERVGTTRRGQAVFRVDAPRRAYLVVKLGPATLAKNYRNGAAAGVLVTVLAPHLWERHCGEAQPELGEAEELLAARDMASGTRAASPRDQRCKEQMTSVDQPPAVTPQHLVDHAPDWTGWAWTIAQIERDRRVAEQFRAQTLKVDELGRLSGVVGRVLTNRASLDELEAAFEALKPGWLAERRAALKRAAS